MIFKRDIILFKCLFVLKYCLYVKVDKNVNRVMMLWIWINVLFIFLFLNENYFIVLI